MLWAIGQVALKNGGYVAAIPRGEAGSVGDFFLTLIYIFLYISTVKTILS